MMAQMLERPIITQVEKAAQSNVASSAVFDINTKRRVYACNDVQGYIVFQMYERRVAWFALGEHGYEELTPGDDGILRSEVFPGLWLEPEAF